MTIEMTPPRRLRVALAVGTTLVAAGCGSDGSAADRDGDGVGASSPLYAVATEIYSGDDTTTYVALTASLESEIDLSSSIEVPDVAKIATFGDALFVSERGRSRVTRYRIDPRGDPIEDGAVSFANYGIPDPGANTFVSAEKAYLFDWGSGDHIVWNPSELAIIGTIPAPVTGAASLDSSPPVVGDGILARTFSWFDWSEYRTLDAQYLVRYDTVRDEVISVEPEDRCAGLTRHNGPDEGGTVHFSNSVYSVTETLVRGAKPSCALRLLDGADGFERDFLLLFSEATGGKEAAALDYLGEGKALITVFHDERVTVDADTDPEELAWSANWRLWHLDLGTRAARPIDEIGWIAGGYTTVRVDGDALVLVATDDYAETRAYAIADDGRASLRFTIPGYSTTLVRVR